MNVSKEIRDYHEKHPDEKPRAIAEGLKKAGIKATPQNISIILSRAKIKAGQLQKRGSSDISSLSDVKRIKELVRQLGNLAEAKKLLEQWEDIVQQFGSLEKVKKALVHYEEIVS